MPSDPSLHCERCFAVDLSRKPNWEDDDEAQEYGESLFDFAVELEAQLGVQYPDGQVYAECPYDGCDGDLKDFVWWEEFQRSHPEVPTEPVGGKMYPLYVS